MKTPKTIQTRRARPKQGFRILHAATRFGKKRVQRASTTAGSDEFTEVPGVGIARALVVILLLHLAAIAGIYIHNRWSEGADIEAKIPALEQNTPPTRLVELKPHTVSSGDNYEKIARKYGVDCQALIEVNEKKVLEPGWIINIPNRLTEEIQPVAAATGYVDQARYQLPGHVAASRPQSYQHQARPLIQSETQSYPGSRPGELAPVEGIEPEPTRRAILIQPRKEAFQSPPPQPRREIIRRPAPQAHPASTVTGRRHIIRAGETLWRIATNHGVSVDALKRANPKVNVSALKIGASLVIPNKR